MFDQGSSRLLVFRVGEERFAVELAAVDEVLEPPPLRPLPDAPHSVLGLATIRGELVTMFDAGALLEIDGAVGDTALLFRRNGRRIGVAISDVDDAFVAEQGDLRAAPGVESSNGILLGVIRRGAELVAVLDAASLVAAATSISEEHRS